MPKGSIFPECRNTNCASPTRSLRSLRQICRLDKLHQDAASIARVHEVDQAAGSATTRLVIQQSDASVAQHLRRGGDVPHPIRDLLHAWTLAIEKAGDRGLLRQRSQQLQLITGVADRKHGLADTLILVLLLVDAGHAEHACIERDGLVQVGHRDADVVDAEQQVGIHIVDGVTGRRHRLGRVPNMTAAASPTVLVAGARTPIGRLLGGLQTFSAAELGGVAIAAALSRAGVRADQVDYVVMGQVLQAGAGQVPARQAAHRAGIPLTVPATTLNKVCLSGMNAIAWADQLVRLGEADIVVAGGMESMSNAPHLLPGSRVGTKYGDATLVDHMAHDGLWDSLTDQPMGALTESCNAHGLRLSREEQDAFSARSHQRAATAAKNGLFDDELVPVEVPQRRGDPVAVRNDEGVRGDTTVESLSRLRPAFADDGTITAGSASQISDGACAVIVMSRSRAEQSGLGLLAEIGAYGMVAGPDSTLQSQPARAIAAACAKQGVDPKALDLVEINEAFAAVGIASTRELGLDEDRVNVNGGAIALGHPIGMSGARIVLHLALELQRRGGGKGAAALCGGGGQGDALMLSVPASR